MVFLKIPSLGGGRRDVVFLRYQAGEEADGSVSGKCSEGILLWKESGGGVLVGSRVTPPGLCCTQSALHSKTLLTRHPAVKCLITQTSSPVTIATSRAHDM